MRLVIDFKIMNCEIITLFLKEIIISEIHQSISFLSGFEIKNSLFINLTLKLFSDSKLELFQIRSKKLHFDKCSALISKLLKYYLIYQKF